jgi:formyltetrahydrofolate deformylase
VSHDSGFILCVACPDRIGVVAAVSTYLAESGLFITESSHYGDPDTGLFFMRVVFAPTDEGFMRALMRALARRRGSATMDSFGRLPCRSPCRSA